MSIAAESSGHRRVRPLRLRVHSWLRWLHIYTSMVSLLVVLFFSVTGITLNHPDWLAGERTTHLTGRLPANWKSGDSPDWLTVAEYLRATHGVHGNATDRTSTPTDASITFKAPGYSADCFITPSTGEYRLTVAYQGAVGVLNDLHRGRDTASAWNWLIDVSGVFLTFVAITGLGLLVYLKKVRVSAFVVMTLASAGVVLVALLVR
ncbi:MAG: PepSY-associated TM helix domain-containing protein [Gemmatimonadaceae bacterium]